MEKISFLFRRMKVIKDQPVLVAYSGGKDSIVCLDMACQIFSHVECYFLYLVKGISFIENYMEWARQKYGVKIHYLPHPLLFDIYKYGVYGPHYKQIQDIPCYNFSEAEAYIKLTTGINWIMMGWKKTDCMLRRAMLKKIDILDLKRKKIFPVEEFTGQEIREYLRLRNITLPENFGKKSSGVGIQAKTIKFIYEKYPEDYKLMRKKFIFLDTVLKREEMKKQDEENEISKM